MSNGNPIIINGGGSIEVLLSKDTFPQDPTNNERHYNAGRRITRVVITDNTSGKPIPIEIPAHGKITISIEHGL
jgi:hypothetical protein